MTVVRTVSVFTVGAMLVSLFETPSTVELMAKVSLCSSAVMVELITEVVTVCMIVIVPLVAVTVIVLVLVELGEGDEPNTVTVTVAGGRQTSLEPD